MTVPPFKFPCYLPLFPPTARHASLLAPNPIVSRKTNISMQLKLLPARLVALVLINSPIVLGQATIVASDATRSCAVRSSCPLKDSLIANIPPEDRTPSPGVRRMRIFRDIADPQ